MLLCTNRLTDTSATSKCRRAGPSPAAGGQCEILSDLARRRGREQRHACARRLSDFEAVSVETSPWLCARHTPFIPRVLPHPEFLPPKIHIGPEVRCRGNKATGKESLRSSYRTTRCAWPARRSRAS